LDKVIEIAERSYDQTGTMRFDPKSIIFLFRFAGEPTRTPYLLSSRMFTDSEYAETMERVQSYWHFHFYALGVKTMEERLKFDAVPENYTELAGLYGRVHEVDKAVNCTQEALRRLKTDELLTRFNEEHRIGLMYKESGRNEEAMAAVQGMLKDLMGMYPTQAEAQTMPRQALEERAQKAMRFISSRMTLASLLTQLEQPWLAWKLIRIDVRLITQRPKFEQFSMPTAVFEKMKELEREGRSLSEEERLLGAELEKMLSDYYGKWAYDKDDSYNDILRKYAFTGMFYGAKYGKSRLLEELLKDGPYPIVKEKDQRRRSGNETDDWTWIRLAPYSYQFLIRKLLDPEPDKIPSAADLSEMIKLSEALERAADRARKYGSLSHLDHEIITVRLARCFVKKEWPGLEAVLNEVKKENWARLTTQAAETFGESARFVTPDEFAVQYKLFSRYIKDRTAYFSVVYAAYRAGAYEHAIRAAKIAMECWPNDEEMKREEKFLEELVRNRLEEKKAKPKAPVQNSTLPNLTPRRTSRFDFLLSPNCWVPAIP
jgi:tetratricopeptide (TPR) repeat protein